MRWKPRALLFAAVGALLVISPALAGNGGVAPVQPQSSNAEAIRDAYFLILAVTGAIFLVVETTLVVFIVRYRRRRRARDAEGPQVRGNTNLEIAWTVVPVLIVTAITAFVFVKLPDIEDAPKAQAGQSELTIGVEGHQYYWLFRYPGGATSIDRMVVPVDRVVNLEVTAPDVIHSWWIPALGGKIDAIPGRTNRTWFQAEEIGVYKGQCAELCGLLHADMLARVEVVSPAEYERFLASHAESSADTVGRETFEGVCAKCHGMQGQGSDFAPQIAGRTFDEATEEVIRSGRGRMPAVGEDWSEEHVDATIEYLNSAIGAGASG